jgi:hypothetical protein
MTEDCSFQDVFANQDQRQMIFAGEILDGLHHRVAAVTQCGDITLNPDQLGRLLGNPGRGRKG